MLDQTTSARRHVFKSFRVDVGRVELMLKSDEGIAGRNEQDDGNNSQEHAVHDEFGRVVGDRAVVSTRALAQKTHATIVPGADRRETKESKHRDLEEV